MTVKTDRVAIDPIHIRKTLKSLKLSGLMVQVMAGYKSPHPKSFNLWMREGKVPADVFEVLQRLGVY